jgi:hypothetical protein
MIAAACKRAVTNLSRNCVDGKIPLPGLRLTIINGKPESGFCS